jgi:CDP-glucose 4,6-dehydratase
MAYLLLAMCQYKDISLAGNYNIGPDETDCWTTGKLVDLFCDKWSKKTGMAVSWIDKYDGGPHEANFLKLDCSKIKSVLGWKPVWDVEMAMEKIVEWTDIYLKNGNVEEKIREQIDEYLGKIKE